MHLNCTRTCLARGSPALSGRCVSALNQPDNVDMNEILFRYCTRVATRVRSGQKRSLRWRTANVRIVVKRRTASYCSLIPRTGRSEHGPLAEIIPFCAFIPVIPLRQLTFKSGRPCDASS